MGAGICYNNKKREERGIFVLSVLLILVIVLIPVSAAVLLLLFRGKARKGAAPVPVPPEGSVLFDFYEKVTGTPEDGRSLEFVLSRETEEALRLDVYEKEYGNGVPETVRSYRVPMEAYDAVCRAAAASGMPEWSRGKQFCPLDGIVYVCKSPVFAGGFRADSERMPEGGEYAFSEIRGILRACIGQENRIDGKQK